MFNELFRSSVEKEARKIGGLEKGCFFWGFRNIPLEVDFATRHFMVTGSTGSGKTTILRLLLKSVLPSINTPGAKTKRALVYDNKREYVSLVHSVLPQDSKTDVFLFNPFDSRTHAWDISSDVTTARHANSIASILVPPDGSSQPFFTDASRAVLSAVMTVFAKLKEADKKPWSLRDVITALRSSERIRLLVSIFPEVEEMVLPYLDDTWAFPSVLSTIATKMAPFEVVAARFEQAKAAGRMLSLSDWLKTESILVVGSSPANRASLDPINRVIFRRLFDLMLDQENQRDALTWVFLDEVREAGKIEGLSSLLNQGRSKGVSVVLGFQEIEGMIQEYGEHVSAEIFGQCGYKSFLRTGSPKTAQWVEHYWGVSHILEASYSDSVTHSKDGTSVTSGVNHSQQFRQAVHASSLMQFPPTGPRSGVLAGYHDIPGKGPILRYQDWSEIVSLLKEDDARRLNLPPEKSNECRWKDQGTQSEVVRTWTKQEISRFKRFALRSGQVSERDLGQREFVFTYGKEGDVQTPEKPPEVLKAEPPQEKSSSHNATDKKEEPEKPPPGGRGKTTQSQLPSRRNR